MNIDIDFNDRITIIKNANLNDASILDENYRFLIKEADSYEERQKYVILQTSVRNRINELKKGV